MTVPNQRTKGKEERECFFEERLKDSSFELERRESRREKRGKERDSMVPNRRTKGNEEREVLVVVQASTTEGSKKCK